jgi:hypothetical protein
MFFFQRNRKANHYAWIALITIITLVGIPATVLAVAVNVFLFCLLRFLTT